MTELDVFDRRLADALRDYAGDAPTVQDPGAFATAIAREHPRRARWLDALAQPNARRVGWIAVAAALVIASLLLLAGTGAFRPEPRLPMPDELFGTHTATVQAAGERVPGGAYMLDLNDDSLLHGPDGEPLRWAGAARAVTTTATGGLELTVRAPWPCGDAQYAFRLSGDDPEASAGPSASGGNPTPDPALTPLRRLGDGEPFRLVTISDPCHDRFQILTSGPWSHPSVEVVAGERYDSMDFTEPFTFVMPSSKAAIPPIESTWGKGMLRLGNGFDWRGFFLDDVPVGVDVCQPGRGRLADIPDTTAEVEAWLRASSGLRVGDSVELPVDGRTALAIPIESIDCHEWEPPLTAREFYLGSRIYAIPTGDDLILFTAVSWGMPDLESVTDDLVRSIRFER